MNNTKKKELYNDIEGTVISNTKYRVTDFLGEGTYGLVVKGVNTQDPTDQQAIKIMSREMLDYRKNKKEYERLMTEKKVLSLINQENILSCNSFIDSKIDNKIYMFSDICDQGDLAQYTRSLRKLNQQKIEEYLAQYFLGSISNGFKILNWYQIMHRDLKPQNIMVKSGVLESGIQKIGDFGGMRFGEKKTGTIKGTPLFIAPEIAKIYLHRLNKMSPCFDPMNSKSTQELMYGSKVDVFSLGCMFYLILFGKNQLELRIDFWCKDVIEQCENIDKKLAHNPNCSLHSLDLVQNMLKADPHERFSWNQFFEHPLMKNYNDYIEFQKALTSKQLFRIKNCTLCCERDLNSLQISRKMEKFPQNYPGEIEHFNFDKTNHLFNAYLMEVDETLYEKVESQIDQNSDINYIPNDDVSIAYAILKKTKDSYSQQRNKMDHIVVGVKRDKKYMKIEFHNGTNINLMYFWVVNYKSRVFVCTLRPGETIVCSSTPNQTWEIFEENEKNILMINKSDGEMLDINMTLQLELNAETLDDPDHNKEVVLPVYSYTTPLIEEKYPENSIIIKTTGQGPEKSSQVINNPLESSDTSQSTSINNVEIPWELLQYQDPTNIEETTYVNPNVLNKKNGSMSVREKKFELGKIDFIQHAHFIIVESLSASNDNNGNFLYNQDLLCSIAKDLLCLAMTKNMKIFNRLGIFTESKEITALEEINFIEDYSFCITVMNFTEHKITLWKRNSKTHRLEAIGALNSREDFKKTTEVNKNDIIHIKFVSERKSEIEFKIPDVDLKNNLEIFVYKPKFNESYEIFSTVNDKSESLEQKLYNQDNFTKTYHVLSKVASNFMEKFKKQNTTISIEDYSQKLDENLAENIKTLVTNVKELIENKLIRLEQLETFFVGLTRIVMSAKINREFQYSPEFEWDEFNYIQFNADFIKTKLKSLELLY